jgi:sigma-E factor negative regulatory protein RseB
MRSNRRVAEVRAAPGGWRPLKLPPGFQLVGTRQQTVPGVPMPVQHLVFSDGFASVSVFIEPGARNGSAPAEASRVGSASTFTTHVRGFVVTAVGEVPPTTVRDLATSLARRRKADRLPSAELSLAPRSLQTTVESTRSARALCASASPRHRP